MDKDIEAFRNEVVRWRGSRRRAGQSQSPFVRENHWARSGDLGGWKAQVIF